MVRNAYALLRISVHNNNLLIHLLRSSIKPGPA